MAQLSVVKANTESEGTPRWVEDLRLQGKRIVKALDEGYFTTAGVLHELATRKTENGNLAWQVWGYKSLADAVWGEFSLKPDRATRFINLYKKVHIELESIDPLLRGKLIALGFSKLSVLCQVLKPKNAQVWAEYGAKPGVTFIEFHNRVREAAALMREDATRKLAEAKLEKKEAQDTNTDPDDDSGPETSTSSSEMGASSEEAPGVPTEMKERYKRRGFSFTDESWELVDGAIERMRQVTMSDIDGYNLSLICLQYMANADYGKKDDYDRALRQYMQLLESKMKVKLVVIDPRKAEIVYGSTSLREFSTAGPSASLLEAMEAEAAEADAEDVEDAQEGAEE